MKKYVVILSGIFDEPYRVAYIEDPNNMLPPSYEDTSNEEAERVSEKLAALLGWSYDASDGFIMWYRVDGAETKTLTQDNSI